MVAKIVGRINRTAIKSIKKYFSLNTFSIFNTFQKKIILIVLNTNA